MVPASTGFICVFIAMIGFGSNFIPVKRFETGDGMFFQWVLCCAIWCCGLIVYCVQGCPTFQPVAMLGAMDIFGESALFPGANGTSKRGATVTTKMSDNEDVQVLALRKIQFNALLASGTLNEDCLNKLKGVAEQRRQENARTTAVAKKQELGMKIGRGKTKGVGVVGK